MTVRQVFGSVMVMCSLLAAQLAPPAAVAETIALIGTGNVSSALGRRFAAQGHTVLYGSRTPNDADGTELVRATGHGARAVTPAEAAAAAEIVVLAVPWDAVESVVRGLGVLDGKIVIDPTNPRITTPEGLRDYALPDSNAERIQRLAPAAKVVKAFNTLGADTMLDPARAGWPVTIPVVGDDPAAKAVVVELAQDIGLEAIDVGPLRHARIVEGLHYLRSNAVGGRINFHLPRDPE
jgi:NADPH-dependent F420 reductase